jgi:hypothetical protein
VKSIKQTNRANAEDCERVIHGDDGLGGEDKIKHYGK